MTRAKDISKIITDADLSGTLDVTGDLTVDTNTLKVDSSNNRVGIGTSPATILHIKESSPIFTQETTGNVTTGGVAYQQVKDVSGSSVFTQGFAGLANCYQFGTSISNGFMRFLTGSAVERMRIDSSGSVGIGTTSPFNSRPGSLTVSNTAPTVYFEDTNSSSYGVGSFLFQDANLSWTVGSRSGTGTSGSSELFRITSSGNVGIGNNNPSAKLDVTGAIEADDKITIAYEAGSSDWELESTSGDDFTISRNGSEKLRIDGSTSTININTTVQQLTTNERLRVVGKSSLTVSGDSALNVNRDTDDGALARFYRGTSLAGAISVFSSYLAIGDDCGILFNNANPSLTPFNVINGTNSDNSVDLGASNARFDDVYATNGTIQTSDRNEKQDIEELSDAEQRVAVVAKGLMRKFRWKDSVAEKGNNARTHFGIIAQDLQDAFTAEGLDANDYAMFCSNTWTDDDGNEQTRLGVRYNQLLAFIISAI